MARAEGKSFLKMFTELKGGMIMPTGTSSGISPDDYSIDNSWAKVTYTGPYTTSVEDLGRLPITTKIAKQDDVEELRMKVEEAVMTLNTRLSLMETKWGMNTPVELAYETIKAYSRLLTDKLKNISSNKDTQTKALGVITQIENELIGNIIQGGMNKCEQN